MFGPLQQYRIAITTSINKQGHVTMTARVQCTFKYPRGARENAATVYKQNLKKRKKKVIRKEVKSSRHKVEEDGLRGEIFASAHGSSSTFLVIITALALTFTLYFS